ncbi:stress response translation initiation inhibitor YciH [Candidatus Micrarchaeota archaeon]|nr:stress response translation initiation inhibitor YciH [Candidatus Micrarchaeota archaeon]
MADICKKCGMLLDLCVCEILDKEETQKIKIYTTAKKFKKLVTVIEGIDKNRLDETASELKHKLACGGSAKNGVVVLQGDHKKRVPDYLIKMGYPKEIIEVR